MAPKKSARKKPPHPQKLNLVGFQPGSHAIVSGGSGRGKTHYIVDAVLGQGVHSGLGQPWDAVIVMCDGISIKQPLYVRLKKEFTGPGGVRLVEGLPASSKEMAAESDDTQRISEPEFMSFLEENKNNGWRTLLIIDDLMTSSKSGAHQSFVDKLFTSARHLNCDVYELTQAHTASRTRRLQCNYLVCFATPTDVKSLAHIARSIKPETKGHDILEAYRQATEGHNGHGCLVMCLGQPNEFMFRNTDMRECFDLGAAPEDPHHIPHRLSQPWLDNEGEGEEEEERGKGFSGSGFFDDLKHVAKFATAGFAASNQKRYDAEDAADRKAGKKVDTSGYGFAGKKKKKKRVTNVRIIRNANEPVAPNTLQRYAVQSFAPPTLNQLRRAVQREALAQDRSLAAFRENPPTDKDYLALTKTSYSAVSLGTNVGDYRLEVNTPTVDAWVNGHNVVITIRGTVVTDFQDLSADAHLLVNRLSKTARYAKDKAVVAKILQRFPPHTYNIYLSGHSLGGAIVNQLKRDFPVIKAGQTFNSAFQPKDLFDQGKGIKRKYTSTDPLYKTGGHLFDDVAVHKTTADYGHKLVHFDEGGGFRRRKRPVILYDD